MMETMIPPQVGMRLRTEKKEAKEAQIKKGERKKAIKKEKSQIKKMREKERRDNATILCHTCA